MTTRPENGGTVDILSGDYTGHTTAASKVVGFYEWTALAWTLLAEDRGRASRRGLGKGVIRLLGHGAAVRKWSGGHLIVLILHVSYGDVYSTVPLEASREIYKQWFPN